MSSTSGWCHPCLCSTLKMLLNRGYVLSPLTRQVHFEWAQLLKRKKIMFASSEAVLIIRSHIKSNRMFVCVLPKDLANHRSPFKVIVPGKVCNYFWGVDLYPLKRNSPLKNPHSNFFVFFFFFLKLNYSVSELHKISAIVWQNGISFKC